MFGIDQILLLAIFCGVTFSAVAIIAYCIPRSASRIREELTKTNDLLGRMPTHMAAATTRGEVTAGTAGGNRKDKDSPSCRNSDHNDDIFCSFLNTDRSR